MKAPILLFETKHVRSLTAAFARVAGPITVFTADAAPLGGPACIAQLDETVAIANRPASGNWQAHIWLLNEEGLPWSYPNPGLRVGVPEDIVLIHAMFGLAFSGGIQLRVRDGHIVPNEVAVAAKPRAGEREWNLFLHRWRTALSTVYFMSRGQLDCAPGNAASLGTDARDLARDLWPRLMEDDSGVFAAALRED